MFGQAYGAALVIIVGSVVLGRAICAACGGRRRWWAAPLVGFAGLLVLADASMRLPGRAQTSVAICAVAISGAAVFLLWHNRGRLSGGDLVVGGVALLGASIPFLASGRVGPGAGIDNDMAIHLLVAEAVRSAKIAAIWGVLASGYPTGPHSLVALVGTAFDLPLIMVFTGLLLAVIVLTALAAADLLATEALWRRVVIGVFCALTYLVSAFYGEGAFKETIMAGLLIGFVVHLEQAQLLWGRATAPRRFGMAVPAGLLVTGAIYTYSYLGVVWFIATLVVWAAAEAISRPRTALGWISVGRLLDATPWVCGFLALAVVVMIPIAGDVRTFFNTVGVSPASSGAFSTSTLGNLISPLSPYEGLGIWWSPDFRLDPANTFHAGELSALALAVMLFGVAWAIWRRRLLLPSAVGASMLIWWYSSRTQSPYVAAKALVIASPILMAIGLRAILTPWGGPRPQRTLVLTFAAVFCLAAGYSSYRSLQSEPVQAPEAGRELAAFHHLTGDATVLFLGIDDWAPSQLLDSPVATLSDPTPNVGGASSPPTKPFASASLDFDSVIPGDLDHFRYVITTNNSFASQPPANFHLLARARLYELWRRAGPTPPFEIIEPPGVPGTVLNCRVPSLRRLAHSRGEASLMVEPLTFPGVNLAPGDSTVVRLALPVGSWELSVGYTSTVTTYFSAQGRRYSLPAYLGRPGSYFDVGSVIGQGSRAPVSVRITAQHPSIFSGSTAYMNVTTIAATHLPDTRQLLPLRQACGKYVDWFRLS